MAGRDEAMRPDAQEKRMKFTEPPMRAPQEIRSLILQATQGCTYGKCNFCYTSRGYLFMAVKPEEMEKAAIAMKPYFPSTTPIYLTGANPFALPTWKLKQYIAVLRRHFPHFSRISLQSRIGDIAKKSDAELAELCRLGLSHLYIGTENGNDEALALMNKGQTEQETVEQLKRLDKAGFTYTTFYILGMAGRGKGQQSAKATAAMFNQVHPRMITSTAITPFARAPIAEMVKTGEFAMPSEREMIEELRTFLAELNIDTFYDGIHYLNPLNYRFEVGDPLQKQHVLDDIDQVLASCSDEELEAMVNRKAKISL
ncbi:MAG: radical SAM protein [Desulfovibrio sp.]|nr:radical SAM protein [Desulfovibrio sp.]